MIPRIEKLYGRIRTEQKYFNDLLQNLNQEQLNFRKLKHKWSILEILYHVYLSDVSIYTFITNFSFERKTQRLGFPSKFASFITNMALYSPLKFKAPVKYLETFPEKIDPESLKTEWEKETLNFENFLETFEASKADLFIFKHPVSKKMNLAQTLGFMYYHKLHHKRQIRALIQNSNYPES